METLVYDKGDSAYLIGRAHTVTQDDGIPQELAKNISADWAISKSSPFVTWIAGDFVEADKPNSNTQYWTAGDLEVAEYTIQYAPLNMVHKFRTPVGFFAETRQVKMNRPLKAVGTEGAAEATGSMKIQALSGMWSHIFPFESAQVEAANDEGLLFYSMECRGSHLKCAGENGCGETFKYDDVSAQCKHLTERSSIRHIVNPVFRGGALIVPPVRPGWKNANASIVNEAVLQEAAAYAEQNEQQYKTLLADGVDLSPSAWESLMTLVVGAGRRGRV